MPDGPGHLHRHRFPAEIISHAVWLYQRFALRFRDIEEFLSSAAGHRTLLQARYQSWREVADVCPGGA